MAEGCEGTAFSFHAKIEIIGLLADLALDSRFASNLLSDGRVLVFFQDPALETWAVDVFDAACAVTGWNKLTSFFIFGLEADAALERSSLVNVL